AEVKNERGQPQVEARSAIVSWRIGIIWVWHRVRIGIRIRVRRWRGRRGGYVLWRGCVLRCVLYRGRGFRCGIRIKRSVVLLTVAGLRRLTGPHIPIRRVTAPDIGRGGTRKKQQPN